MSNNLATYAESAKRLNRSAIFLVLYVFFVVTIVINANSTYLRNIEYVDTWNNFIAELETAIGLLTLYDNSDTTIINIALYSSLNDFSYQPNFPQYRNLRALYRLSTDGAIESVTNSRGHTQYQQSDLTFYNVKQSLDAISDDISNTVRSTTRQQITTETLSNILDKHSANNEFIKSVFSELNVASVIGRVIRKQLSTRELADWALRDKLYPRTWAQVVLISEHSFTSV